MAKFSKDRGGPPAKKWKLKGCDVNKDIEIDRAAQITLPNIQIPSFEKAISGNVKLIGNRVIYRIEQSLSPNKPLNIIFGKIKDAG